MALRRLQMNWQAARRRCAGRRVRRGVIGAALMAMAALAPPLGAQTTAPPIAGGAPDSAPIPIPVPSPANAPAIATSAASPPIPAQPTDPVAAKAYGVFDQACAGCHQTGRLKGLTQPSGALGAILDLDNLARNPAWVRPGQPDASPLYTVMQSRAMPPEATAEGQTADISATELAAVRDWIAQLPATACTPQERVTPAAMAAAIAQAARAMEPAKALTTRYISLAPLVNACAPPTEVVAARHAVTVLINSLSLGLEPVKLAVGGPEGALLEVDLGLIGWDAERWDRLAVRAPATPFLTVDAATRSATGTAYPVVNGDWFADAASRAPLYYDLLGVPDTLASLYASLKIDAGDQKRGAVDRIGIRVSAVARGNRLIERRPFANGSAWIAREFAPTAGRPDLFDLTVAAASANPPRPQVQPDATLVHFDLPNGFPAYFIANAAGGRLNDAPQSILRDEAHPSDRFAVAQSCLGCHGAATERAPVALGSGQVDDLRARLAADTTLAKDVRDRLLQAHPDRADWQRLIEDDQQRLRRAMTFAGLDRTLQIDGLQPLPALIARYRRSVTAAELADLVDMPQASLLELGKNASASLADLLLRVRFGPVPRTEVDASLSEIAARRGLNPAGNAIAVVPARAADAANAPALVLTADRELFEAGDLLTVTARPNFNCYLTMLTLDSRGRATVLYPNEFEPNNFVEAGRDVRVPGEKAPFQFRLRDKGRETLIGICSAIAKTVDGIRHDFEKQRFTELGDYVAFLNRNWGNRETPDSKPARSRGARKPTDPPVEPAKPDQQARTAISITIQ